jgi:hypothetical protein
VHDLNVETFLSKVLGLERDCGMLDVKGMPTGITDSQFQVCSSWLLSEMQFESSIAKQAFHPVDDVSRLGDHFFRQFFKLFSAGRRQF